MKTAPRASRRQRPSTPKRTTRRGDRRRLRFFSSARVALSESVRRARVNACVASRAVGARRRRSIRLRSRRPRRRARRCARAAQIFLGGDESFFV
eukprot:31303-Pelagococcus_subviridis.AAC.14